MAGRLCLLRAGRRKRRPMLSGDRVLLLYLAPSDWLNRFAAAGLAFAPVSLLIRPVRAYIERLWNTPLSAM
jgi:hypothetical protein